MLTLLQAAEEHSEEAAAVSPYLIGAIALAILVVMLLGLLAFGKGREHT
ncbi:hypothetical protein [Aeromicrobium sp. Root495]|nr:hypothetical protein [Aeromicrobium sp. Root495]